MPRREIPEKNVPDLLERAPLDLSMLPEFFALLDADQLRKVAVAAIVDCAERDGFPHLANLDLALKAWRDHPGVAAIPRAVAPAPAPKPGSGRRIVAVSDEQLYEFAVRAAPNIGDTFKLKLVYRHEGHRQRAKHILAKRPEFTLYKDHSARCDLRAPLYARRIA